MWFLKRLNGTEIYYLLVGKQYTVGRKNTDICISNDPSISRKHAVFVLSHPDPHLNNLERLPVLTLKDVGSKYGTYVYSNQKVGLEAIILKVGDKITFGQCDASFQLFYEPIIITTSCVEKEDKEQLKNLIQRLGGHFLPEWSKDCTHLVMKELKVTIKAVCAMVSLKPVVTKEFFENLILHAEGNKNLPDPESYIPDLGEPILDQGTAAFHCKKERKVMFQNKTFICTSPKQYKKLQPAINLAGGKVILIRGEDEIATSLILHADTCIVKFQSDSSQTSQPVPHYIAKIEDELKKNKKRMIPESDIGLAVVYCSTEKYCNPDFNMASSLFAVSKLHSQTLSQQDIYVADTQASTTRSTLDRTKSNYGLYVADSLERSKQASSFNINHQNEMKSPIKTVSQNGVKRVRHFSKPENPPKQMKLQDIDIKMEACSSKGDVNDSILKEDEHLPDISKIAVKSEPTTPFDNKIAIVEDDDMNELTFPYSNEVSDDALLSTVKVEACNKSTLSTKPSADEVQSEISERLEERMEFPVSINGFLSKTSHDLATTTSREEQIFDKELPSRLLKVEFASLCPRRDVNPKLVTNDSNRMNSQRKNFKKFRKVYSTGNRLPIIIGGRDLIVYNKNTSRDLNSWINDNTNMHSQENEEVGLFDWDSNKRSR